MKQLRRFETENEYKEEVNNFELPTISYTDDNEEVWICGQENYIIATYTSLCEEVVDYDTYICKALYSPIIYIENDSIVFSGQKPEIVLKDELLSVDETSGEATYKITLKRGYEQYDLGDVFGGLFLGSGCIYSTLKHIDFSNVHKPIINLNLDGTMLTEIVIPNTLTSIDTMEEIEGVTPSYFMGGFAQNHNVTSITFEDGCQLKALPMYCFICCGDNTETIFNITIPNSIEEIGFRCFSRMKIESIFIPKSVKLIGEDIIDPDNNCDIIIDNENETYHSDINKNAIIETSTNNLIFANYNYNIVDEEIVKLGGQVYYNSQKITSLTLPNTLTDIGEYSINSCGYLKTITCYATTAPTLGSGALKHLSSNGKLRVPQGSDYSTWKSVLGSGWTVEYISE